MASELWCVLVVEVDQAGPYASLARGPYETEAAARADMLVMCRDYPIGTGYHVMELSPPVSGD